MKRSIFLPAMLIGVLLFAQCQVNVSSAAKSAFEKTYPTATNVKWEKEGNDFEVNFDYQQQHMEAVYTASGSLKETEVTVTVADLPAAVQEYVKKHYDNQTIKEAAKITFPDRAVNYEAEVKGKDLIFDEKGNFIKESKD